MLKKLSSAYDSLQEPYRFFVFFVMVFGPYLPMFMAMGLYAMGVRGLPIIALIVWAVTHLVLFCIFALYRAFQRN